MNKAPFAGMRAAPAGVSLKEFDTYIEETHVMLENQFPDLVITPQILAQAIQKRAAYEIERQRQQDAVQPPPELDNVLEEELRNEGVVNDDAVIADSLAHGLETQDWIDAEEHEVTEKERTKRLKSSDPLSDIQDVLGSMHVGFSLIDRIAQHIEIAVEVCMYLPPLDIINLYSVSRKFNETISANLTSSIRMWVRCHAEESGEIFSFKLYRKLCVPDPVGRLNSFESLGGKAGDPTQKLVRLVPSLRWYHMVMTREVCVNNVVDKLEDARHHLPPGIEPTLKKMWLLMDVATTQGREEMLRNTALWTKEDLYNAQMFFVKLNMYFDDPIWPSPGTNTLSKLMLGQRGLYKLWTLLVGVGFKNLQDIAHMKVHYDYIPTREEFRRGLFGEPVHGVAASEVGTVHLEGWGRGTGHLYRPDELIPAEASRRGFQIDKHIIYMILWGKFDYDDEGAGTYIQNIEASSSSNVAAGADATQYGPPPYMDDDEEDGDEEEAEAERKEEEFAAKCANGLQEWRLLPALTKSFIMKEHIDMHHVSRGFLLFLHEEAEEVERANGGFEDDASTTTSAAETSTNRHGGQGMDNDDDIDFSALPDPDDADAERPPRAAALDAVIATYARLSGDAPITSAIQKVLDEAHKTSRRDVNLHDFISRRLYGSCGLPTTVELMDRSDQAWADYEQEDYDADWVEYVDEINAPSCDDM